MTLPAWFVTPCEMALSNRPAVACTTIRQIFSTCEEFIPQPRAAALQEHFRFGCGSAALCKRIQPLLK